MTDQEVKIEETPQIQEEKPQIQEEKSIQEDKPEVQKDEIPPQTTLLLEEKKESPFKMLIFLSFVCIFGYFIIKMDNIYYKISFIISFMILSYFFKKHFNPFNNKNIKDDNGVNLIEG